MEFRKIYLSMSPIPVVKFAEGRILIVEMISSSRFFPHFRNCLVVNYLVVVLLIYRGDLYDCGVATGDIFHSYGMPELLI